MGWGNGSSPAARRRRRLLVATVGTAGLLASAVGATGVQSLAETLTADRHELVRRWPFFAAAEAAAPTVAATAIVEASQPAPSAATVGASSATALPRSGIAIAPVASAPIKLAARARSVVATATVPAAAADRPSTAVRSLPPVARRSFGSASEGWFGTDDAAPRTKGRALADRGGVAIEFADAGPIADVGPLAGVASPRAHAVLPDVIEDAPAGGGALGSPIVAPPLEQVIDSGGMGIDTGLAEGEVPPVDVPWEQIIDDGILDLPGWDLDWTPGGDGVAPAYLIGPDGSIVVDANGLPVLAPEPTGLVAIAAGVALLARRRRRRH